MCIYVEFSEWASEQAKIYMIFPNERASWKSAPSVPSATSIAGQITALNTKIYWAQKSKKNCDQTFWIPKNSKELKSNKFYGPKRFGISKYFEPQKMLGPKKFLIPKYLGWKIQGAKQNWVPKNYCCCLSLDFGKQSQLLLWPVQIHLVEFQVRLEFDKNSVGFI